MQMINDNNDVGGWEGCSITGFKPSLANASVTMTEQNPGDSTYDHILKKMFAVHENCKKKKKKLLMHYLHN